MTADHTKISPDRWPELMQLAQGGDAVAYRTLLNAIAPAIRSFLKARFFNRDHVEDVSQEILLAIHTARHTYRPEQPFQHWMYGIARHKTIDYYRKQTRQDAREIGDDALVTFLADPSNTPEETLSGKDLTSVMEKLPARQRSVLMLTKVDGYSMAEAAKKLGLSETATKVTAHRAYKKLKELLISHGYQ